MLERMLQEPIEAEVTTVIGAAPHQRTSTRTTYRNGHLDRTLATTSGDVELKIPKLRTGSFFPCLLERRRRIDPALFAIIMEAYVHGVSTRAVDDLVTALGPTPASPRPRSHASALSWMGRSARSPSARWTTPCSPTCSWTRPTARRARSTASPQRPWSSPPE
ncbi:hypothetical protein GCM10009800_23190 [Nocardiopsis rhodophaea]